MRRKFYKAIVLWFDKSSGEGMINIENQHSQFIVACDIPGKKTWYPNTACTFYKDGQKIKVWFDKEINQFRPATPGFLDKRKWNRIKNQNLAFRCNSRGKAINGLMGKGASMW